ncbi:MAG TPA: AMP-binding protein, partial [Myxococcaceae bacterium]|nr:AMP-binding protein [Myxococcaceae bacterium]
MLKSTMQDWPLTLRALFAHGRAIHGSSQVVTAEAARKRRSTFDEVARRVERLAAALARLGVRPGDGVGSFCWNTQEHLEAYLAVPAMGAVLHTINIRLFTAEIAHIVNHARDRFILVDDCLVPALAAAAPRFDTVERFIVIGDGDARPLGDVLRYDALLEGPDAGFAWPEIDERAAAVACYTSGTTGPPKGVVYSHRSCFLHAMGVCSGAELGLTERDRVLPIVPMFHANAWGLPYAAWLAGSDLILPGRHPTSATIARAIAEERAT